ncbi:MAG: hypothetical protein ACLSG1_05245 [Anaerotignum faecicola]
MKKKLMALGMAAVLAFGAAGCGGGTDAKTDDTALGILTLFWTGIPMRFIPSCM